uniref:THAP-type domain-containing protein n=1 Tax=Meloidogyne enterolobii TaxID=390850 RepID=A0A6V7UR71_MELEN|nr:unnamed protein product [Meloidogyne enterolobii]
MPTTCGYPNCKFRSRYRGQEDNRHFYRIPKRPAVLRQAWLNAIGRNEETVLRICSAHFFGGEKHEGDIPVADPQIDTPKFIELPPKESRTAERKSRLKALSSAPPSTNIITTISSPSLLINSQRSSSSTSTLNQNSSISRHSRRGYRTHFGLPFNQRIIRKPSFNSHLNFGNLNSSLFNSDINNQQQPPLLPQPPQISLLSNKSPTTQTNILTNNLPTEPLNNIQKPLVALLDGRDCSVEMPLLKDVATVAFCDAQSINDIHEKVLNEATVALLYQSISLGREEFNKFKSLKAVIRIGPGYNNIDINAATELGIAICHTPVECVEENADSAISLILNLFRKTFSLCNFLQNGKKTLNIDQISELMNGSQRIRGSTLGIVGMGSVGIAVALRAKSFGFRVLFYDNNLALGMENALGIERCSNLTELFSHSDCLTLHCPLTSENKHLINSETIKYLKFGAFLVNTTEFDLIESNSLISALKSGNIRSFAMDCDQPKNIFERENYGKN